MNDDNRKVEIDDVSGVETTGHEWDGLKELNNPTPRWWLWVFYITVIWSVGYWVVYPAWPTLSGHTKGWINWTQQKGLERSQVEIVQRQAAYLDRFEQASFDDIMNDPALYNFAVAGGRSAFKDNCATCHGSGGAGGKGYPNLNDDDWIWGGKIDEIYKTLQYGIRSGHDRTHFSQMPAFGRDAVLKREEIDAVVDYVMVLNRGKGGTSHPGYTIYQENCAFCHGETGAGGRDVGAPDLTDAIWLYGGDRNAIHASVFYSRRGVMPYWQSRLDDNTIRQLAVYVHSLGGGEEGDADDKDEPDADTGAGTVIPE